MLLTFIWLRIFQVTKAQLQFIRKSEAFDCSIANVATLTHANH